jgi:tetratricopeptide (TPR) repeat protein
MRGSAGKRANITVKLFQTWLTVAAGVSLAIGAAANASPARPARAARAAPSVRAPAQADAILDNVVDRIWERGDWYWHEGRYEERVALDRLVIRMDPHFIEPYSTAGWLLESLGRDQDALALYRQAVDVVPERWETHQDLAMYLYQHKEYAAAAEEFQRATEQPHPPVYVWKMLAHAYEHNGELEKAAAAWETAGRMAPEDPAVGVNLSRIRARLKGSD